MTPVTKLLWLALPAAVGAALCLVGGRLTPVEVWILVGVLTTTLAGGYVVRTRSRPPRYVRRRPANVVQVSQSLQLPGRGWLHAVEFNGRTLLIGAHGGRLVRLDDAACVTRKPDAADFEREGGVDLHDTPRDLEELADARRPLARSLESQPLHRADLSEASLAAFRKQVAAARESTL